MHTDKSRLNKVNHLIVYLHKCKYIYIYIYIYYISILYHYWVEATASHYVNIGPYLATYIRMVGLIAIGQF